MSDEHVPAPQLAAPVAGFLLPFVPFFAVPVVAGAGVVEGGVVAAATLLVSAAVGLADAPVVLAAPVDGEADAPLPAGAAEVSVGAVVGAPVVGA